MRTIVDLPEEQIVALDRLAQAENTSRAALIRRSIGLFLEHSEPRGGERPGFGIWRGRSIDGLAYQQRLREEWDR